MTYLNAQPDGGLTFTRQNLCNAGSLGTLYGISVTRAQREAVVQNGTFYLRTELNNDVPVQVPACTTSDEIKSTTYGPGTISPAETISCKGMNKPYFMTVHYSCYYSDGKGQFAGYTTQFESFVINGSIPPQSPIDISIGEISVSPTKNELDGNFSVPANTLVTIKVPVLGNGISISDGRSVSVSLSMGGRTFPPQPVNLKDILSNSGQAEFSFATTDEEVGSQDMNIVVSSIPEDTNLTNNSLIKKMHILCNLEDSGKSVEFESQVNPLWKDDPFGIIANSIKPGTVGQYGCSMTDFMMVSKMYGIKNTPVGSPLNPEVNGVSTLPGLKGELLTPKTLNWAFQNYKTKIETAGSVALNGKNDPIWEGMAQVARAGYRAQCRNPANNCNPSEASNIISLSSIKLAGFNSTQGSADQKAVIKEICRGNPVILKFKKATQGQHYMLATGMRVDSNGAISYRLHDPGSRNGENTFQDILRTIYPTILGYVIYKSAHDPSMMTLAAPLNVHFVLTDSLGRRSGYDPNANIIYNEIPGASYGEQSIDTPSETEFTDKTLVAERYYVSTSDTPAGNYQIKTFAVSGGSYYLDLRTTDRDGYLNDANFKAGTLATGQSETTTFVHSIESVPEPTANLDISNYIINLRSKGFLDVGLIFGGKIKPFVSQSINLTSAFKVSVGGVNGYRLEIPASQFKVSTLLKKRIYTYLSADAKIILTESGEFEVILKKSSLLGVSLEKAGYIRIDVDTIYSDALTNLKCDKNICMQSRK